MKIRVLGAVVLNACAAAPAAKPPASAPSAPAALADPRETHLADLRQLTFGGENAEAYWSWDGAQIIFQSTRPPFACDQIFTMPLDYLEARCAHCPAVPAGAQAPEATLVSTGRGRTTCSYFFPGNRHILFSSTHEAAPDCPPRPDMSQGYVWALYDSYDIFSARPDGSELKNISHSPGYDAEATVCGRDGSVIFTSTRDGDIELYRMDPDGGNVARLTHSPGYDGGAYFSPDCQKIVWRASRPRPGRELDDYKRLLAQGLVRPTTLEIWVANADGSEAQQITYLDAASFGPSWFPSGNRVIFASNTGDASTRGREFDLWAVDVNGTGLERITYTPQFDGFPMFSPDGQRLVFASNRHGKAPGETDVFVARWVDAAAQPAERAPDRFYRNVAWLADDAREGRGVGTRGLDEAADYVEQKFKQLGLEPAGDGGGFRQRFDVATQVRVGAGSALAIDGKAAVFVPAGFSVSGQAGGEVVYAGYGVTAPELGYDDYQGLDVKGKIVLVRRFAPDGGRWEDRLQRRVSEPRYKAWNAREHGASGLLIADLGPEKEKPLPQLAADTLGDAGLPVAFVARDSAAPLVKGPHRAQLRMVIEADKAPVYNIVARVPGKLRSEVVVVGAHYDHLGMGGPSSLAPGVHAPHHGADDNASGVAGLLEVARSLMERRGELARDVVLVAFSAEELGILGSTAFTRAPPGGLKMAQVKAMLNMDMIGRLRDNTVQVLGGDTADEWRPLIEEACRRSRLQCTIGNGGYGPSDQTPFYAAGVPVLFFFTGSHRDYHKPTDTADLINAAGGAQIAGLVADLVMGAAAAGALTYRATPAPEPRGDLRASGASLGTVPDYVGPPNGQPGVLLAGVRPGGPADKAGMRRGDILVALDGHQVRTVEDFMYALQRSQPGAHGKVKVLRGGKPVELDVVFGPPTMR